MKNKLRILDDHFNNADSSVSFLFWVILGAISHISLMVDFKAFSKI